MPNDYRQAALTASKCFKTLAMSRSVPGNAPELSLYDAKGTVVEKLNVEKYTFNGLHDLLKAKGFKEARCNAHHAA